MTYIRRRNVPRNVAVATNVRKPSARESAFNVNKAGRLELQEQTLAYDTPAIPPAKRPRLDIDSRAGPSVLHEVSSDGIRSEGLGGHQHDAAAMWDDLESTEDICDGDAREFSMLEDSEGEDDSSLPRNEQAADLPGAAKATAKKTTPSARMKQFEPHFQAILDDMLWKEYDERIAGRCATRGCPHLATTRCRECRCKEPLCDTCTVQAHRNLPFHWVEVWNGFFFQRRDLRDLGFVVYLGHHGDACPHIPTGHSPISFVIVHDNGIHQCRLHYCHCPGRRDKLSQLVRADLFPASLDRIETAFTCDVLERFHVDYDVSKRSTQDFVRVLTSLSASDEETGEVKDRYRDFLFASRIYRYLTMVKRSGRRHGVAVPGRNPEDLTVPCFACPIPSFNLPEDWKQTPDHLKYIYRIVLCADGNYSLQKKTKPDDEADKALSTGQGFFVPPSVMHESLSQKYQNKGGKAKGKGKDKDVESESPEDIGIVCAGFKVVRSQRTGKFKYVDVSGVVSFSCDHLHFRPGATVDLQTTETWMHCDFGLSGALRGTEELEEHGLSYDVVCSYICHILSRMEKSHPTMLDIVKRLKMLLPKLHMHAHKELCQIVYAFCYARGFGLAHGEGVETPWAELNAAGLSTREMTAGARHDALDALFNYWNWRKTVGMGKFLARKLREAYTLQRQTTRYLSSLTVLARAEVVSIWLEMDIDDEAPTPLTFRQKTKDYTKSIYLLDRAEVPSGEGAVEEIARHASGARASSHTDNALARIRTSAARFIHTGVELEMELRELKASYQRRGTKSRTLRSSLPDGVDDEASVSWQRFRTKLRTWRTRQRKHMPTIEDILLLDLDGGEDLAEDDLDEDDAPPDDPAALNITLGLPSHFTQSDRTAHGFETLADYELKIRIGIAYDQLDAIRLAVQHRAAQLDHKKKHVRTNKANAVAEEHIKKADRRAKDLASRYNSNYERIVALRPLNYTYESDNTPGRRLQRIDLNSDLMIANIAAARTEGDSRRTGSWIWSVFEIKDPVHVTRQHGKTKVTYTNADMVQWFRAKAAKDRADEAVNKICAEFRRTCQGFGAYADLWRQAAEDESRPAGERAYASKTAAMWSRMRTLCEQQYNASRRRGVEADRLDQTRSMRPYLRQLLDNRLEPYEGILATLRMPPDEPYESLAVYQPGQRTNSTE
ncbi:hypothetical protein OH77DRAFT_1502180 [Trametes cingulata]|nr:hypothetical protein OH77DRAFT_1502180 [Trametes cingulata]